MRIKIGDLVMVVCPTPCCANSSLIGLVFTVSRVFKSSCECGWCGHIFHEELDIVESSRAFMLAACLKKIDPPADGDSLPTRKEIEVPA